METSEMTKQEFERLERRLELLERSRDRARAGLAAVAVGAVALLAAGFAGQDEDPQEETVAEAEPSVGDPGDELILRDGEGRKRVWLGVLPSGECGLGLYDETETARAEFFVGTKGEARLLVTDRLGTPRAFVGVAESGLPLLRFANGKGVAVLEAGLMADGSARVRVKDANNGGAADLRVLEDGRPGLDLTGSDGRNRVTIGVSSQGAPGIRLKGEDGRTVFERP